MGNPLRWRYWLGLSYEPFRSTPVTEPQQDPRNKPSGFRVRRDSVVGDHWLLPGVIGGKDKWKVVSKSIHQGTEVTDATLDVFWRVPAIANADDRGRLWHQLHQAHRTLWRHGAWIGRRFDGDDRKDESLGHAMACSGGLDMGGDRREILWRGNLVRWMRAIGRFAGPIPDIRRDSDGKQKREANSRSHPRPNHEGRAPLIV